MILDSLTCVAAVYNEGQIRVSYADGNEVCFPVSVNRRLRSQPDEKLGKIEIGHFGIHWPDLDKDLSHEGIRAGRYGQA
jgi:hypothetical protein